MDNQYQNNSNQNNNLNQPNVQTPQNSIPNVPNFNIPSRSDLNQANYNQSIPSRQAQNQQNLNMNVDMNMNTQNTDMNHFVESQNQNMGTNQFMNDQTQNMNMNYQPVDNQNNLGMNEPTSNNNQIQNQQDIPLRSNLNNSSSEMPINDEVYEMPKKNKSDDIDSDFSIPKKKFPIWIIPVILLLLVIGFGAYYYFVLDNPKNIFSTVVENTLVKVKDSFQEKESLNTEFSLNAKVVTNNEEYKAMANIINKISISSSISINKNEELSYGNINTKYNEKDLLSVSYLTELSDDGNMYFKLNDILDKIIKITPEELTTEETEEDTISINDMKKLVDIVKNALIDTLNISEFKKEYVDLDGQKVKKIILVIDKNNVTYFCNELQNSSEFVDIYTKMTGDTIEDLEKELDEIIDLYNDDVEEISIYLSILKNEFLKLEDKTEEETFTISKDGDKYSFELYTPARIEFQGYVIASLVEDKNNLIINFDNPNEETTVELDLLYKTGSTVEVAKIETKDAIDIDSLTEEDYNKILEAISENEAILEILKDLGLEDSSSLNV